MEHVVMSGERKLSLPLIMLLSFISLVLLTSQCQHHDSVDREAHIALYSDRGVWPESVQAAERMFQWMGYSTDRIDADDVKDGVLDNFALLCVPGGNMYQYAQDLSSIGIENMRSFVRSTCLRNSNPIPLPRWAPSTMPGMSATTNRLKSSSRTTPRFGESVVKG